ETDASRRAEEKDLRTQSRTHNNTNVRKVRRNSGKSFKSEGASPNRSQTPNSGEQSNHSGGSPVDADNPTKHLGSRVDRARSQDQRLPRSRANGPPWDR